MPTSRTISCLILLFLFINIRCSDKESLNNTATPVTDDLQMSSAERLITVNVYVYMQSDNTPVEGAKVYNNQTGQLLGTTKDDGRVNIVISNGGTIRVVEPNYGQQQGISEINVPQNQNPYIERSWAWNQQGPYQN